MNTANRPHALGPLPKADRSAELQRLSIDAFKAALPTDSFIFRDERTDDAGVDASLELLIDSQYTNLRAQVQLKSTDAQTTNQDGSISLQVRTSNLNYLLNGQSPLYVLYVASRKELRFAWARDERRRLDRVTPEWMNQDTITIRFDDVLTSAALVQIHERIRQEAQLHRRIHDMLGRASVSEQVVTSIDSATFANSDPDETREMLLASGTTAVSAGYADQVKTSLGFLKPVDARLPRIQLVRAYAEYATGRYQAAIAAGAEATLSFDQLSLADQRMLTYIRDACDYQMGRIDAAEHKRRLDEQIDQSADGVNPSLLLTRTRLAIFGEEDIDRRDVLLAEMRSAVQQILADDSDTDGFKLHARLILLESEGHQALLYSLGELHQEHLRHSLGRGFDIAAALRSQRDRWNGWEQRTGEAMREAAATRNPLLFADASVIRAGIRAGFLINYRLLSLMFGVAIELSEEMLRPPKLDVEQAIKIYTQAGHLKGELRAKMTLADVLDLSGRTPEAQEITRDVLPKARAMSYAALEWRANAHIAGRSILNSYKNRIKARPNIDMDFRMVEHDDQTLKKFASDALKALDLPGERLPVVEREYFSFRDIARERIDWCRHINLIQDLRHTQHASTYYRVDPSRSCECQLHKVRSKIESEDWISVISAFKQTYCSVCPDRAPKTTQPSS